MDVEIARLMSGTAFGPRFKAAGIRPARYRPVRPLPLAFAIGFTTLLLAGSFGINAAFLRIDEARLGSVFEVLGQGMFALLGLMLAAFAVVSGWMREVEGRHWVEVHITAARRELHFNQFRLFVFTSCLGISVDLLVLWTLGGETLYPNLIRTALALNLLTIAIAATLMLDALGPGRDDTTSYALLCLGTSRPRVDPAEYQRQFDRLETGLRRLAASRRVRLPKAAYLADQLSPAVLALSKGGEIDKAVETRLIDHLYWNALVEHSAPLRVPMAICKDLMGLCDALEGLPVVGGKRRPPRRPLRARSPGISSPT